MESCLWVGNGEERLWALCKARSETAGANTREPWRLGRSRTRGVGVGNRMGCPGLLPSTPGAHLKVHEAYAKRVPLASREQEPKPDQPSWYCPGAVSVACREQQVSPAPLPWQLQHLVLKGKAGKGRWRRHSAAFLEKPICFFPQEVMLGGQGKKMGIWGLEKEGREKTPRCSKSSFPDWRCSPSFGGRGSKSLVRPW